MSSESTARVSQEARNSSRPGYSVLSIGIHLHWPRDGIFMAQVLQGTIILFTLFDVCDEINLKELQRLIGGTPVAPALKHAAPEHVRFERPPVIEVLPPVTIATGEQ